MLRSGGDGVKKKKRSNKHLTGSGRGLCSVVPVGFGSKKKWRKEQKGEFEKS